MKVEHERIMTRMTEHTHTLTHIYTQTHPRTQWLSLCGKESCNVYSWWPWGPCWLWLKGTLPSVQNNVAHTGKKLPALSDWRVPLGRYLATGLLTNSEPLLSLCHFVLMNACFSSCLRVHLYHLNKLVFLPPSPKCICCWLMILFLVFFIDLKDIIINKSS